MKGYGQGKMSGGKKTGSCHDASNKGYEDCGYAKPKPIGSMASKATPDMPTPTFGPGKANAGGKKK